jgi:hypothetical protein
MPKGTERRKRKSGIPTGNAGEYFVMGELLKRGYDAQLADRNTKGYDVLVGKENDRELKKVQIKTVRSQPWFVRPNDFAEDAIIRTTIYVLLGSVDSKKPIRYFIAKNLDLADDVKKPANWKSHAFMPLRAITQFEDKWDTLLS